METTRRTKTTTPVLSLINMFTVLFVALKLTGTLAWSWWWVLSPLWIGYLVLPVALLILYAIIVILVAIVQASRKQ